jgi:hypothetical protein
LYEPGRCSRCSDWATGFMTRGVVVRFFVGQESCVFSKCPDWFRSASNLCPQGPGESVPKCKATWHEADNLLTHSAEVKNEWSYTSTPYALSWRTQWQITFCIHSLNSQWSWHGLGGSHWPVARVHCQISGIYDIQNGIGSHFPSIISTFHCLYYATNALYSFIRLFLLWLIRWLINLLIHLSIYYRR